MLKSNLDGPFIIRMRSHLTPDQYIDLSSHASVAEARKEALVIAEHLRAHITLTVLDVETLGDHGEFYGEL